ncbi:hypothetical protein ACPPVV_11000 [Rhodanobacter sp. Col0626]|uniref:hypothetical protein n=1 Tax=Rhodanobacter sp. Col0626 TaxID=3415679 RepID=UPI003CE840D7
MFNLLSLPRASWKTRLAFCLWLALVISLMVQQWPHRHDDLAIARWIAWFFLVSGVLYLPKLMVVVLFGRLPKVYQHMFKGLNRTLPQIHADFAREQREQRERSREL